MIWVKVEKDAAKQPAVGTYSDWKPLIAEESHNRCVYCAIHENSMGGIRNFHVEHYRPRSKFTALENCYMNLFYACPICNTFKSNDWPNEPVEDNSIPSYPNPCSTDYNTIFRIDAMKGLIEGENVAARYVQEKLFLNRPQLILERRMHFILDICNAEIEKTRCVLQQIQTDAEYRHYSQAFMDLWGEFNRLEDRLRAIPHYKMADVKK